MEISAQAPGRRRRAVGRPLIVALIVSALLLAACGEAQVAVDDLKTYTHPSQLFEVGIPSNWTEERNDSASGLVQVLWSDPLENGSVFILVEQLDSAEPLEQESKVEVAQQLLEDGLGEEPDFQLGTPEAQGASTLVPASYTSVVEEQRVAMQMNAYVQQQDDKITVLVTEAPQSQMDELKPVFDQIVGSYRLNPEVALP